MRETENGRWVWYQEVDDMIIPGSRSTAPKNASPWLVLTFNSVDGEQYGRGRVEEFLGDLKSLEGLSQALVEGAAAASKVIFQSVHPQLQSQQLLQRLETEQSCKVEQRRTSCTSR